MIIQTLTGHLFSVASLCYSPDGTMLASGSYDKTIKIWSFKTGIGIPIKKLEGHTSQVNSVCISPDNNRIVSGSFDRRIIIWDLNTSNRLKII